MSKPGPTLPESVVPPPPPAASVVASAGVSAASSSSSPPQPAKARVNAMSTSSISRRLVIEASLSVTSWGHYAPPNGSVRASIRHTAGDGRRAPPPTPRRLPPVRLLCFARRRRDPRRAGRLGSRAGRDLDLRRQPRRDDRRQRALPPRQLALLAPARVDAPARPFDDPAADRRH